MEWRNDSDRNIRLQEAESERMNYLSGLSPSVTRLSKTIARRSYAFNKSTRHRVSYAEGENTDEGLALATQSVTEEKRSSCRHMSPSFATINDRFRDVL